MPVVLRTPRLPLSPLEERDRTALHTRWNDPQVARFLWDATPVPLQTVAQVIADSSQTFKTSGWGLWSLRLTGADPLIGVCGLRPFEHGDQVELLYSLAHPLVQGPHHRSRQRRPHLRLHHPRPPRGPGHHRQGQPRVPPPPHPPRRHPHARIATHPSFTIRPGMLLQGPCSSMDRATDF